MTNEIHRLNSLSYQIYKLKLLYSEIFNENIGLTMQLNDLLETIEILISKKENKL